MNEYIKMYLTEPILQVKLLNHLDLPLDYNKSMLCLFFNPLSLPLQLPSS